MGCKGIEMKKRVLEKKKADLLGLRVLTKCPSKRPLYEW